MRMPATDRKIVVLGAGITGLTVAWELSRTFPGRVLLLEKEAAVGGLAATFTRDQLAFDTGSHRLHDGYHPEVDRLIRDLCGPDLLRRDRKGLILIQNRPLRYPPSAFDILSAFGLTDLVRFSLGFLQARLECLVRRREPNNFEDYTMAKVGRGLYERFYKPYAQGFQGVGYYNRASLRLGRVPEEADTDVAESLSELCPRAPHLCDGASGLGASL